MVQAIGVLPPNLPIQEGLALKNQVQMLNAIHAVEWLAANVEVQVWLGGSGLIILRDGINAVRLEYPDVEIGWCYEYRFG